MAICMHAPSAIVQTNRGQAIPIYVFRRRNFLARFVQNKGKIRHIGYLDNNRP